jgi:hypothetical protein
MTRRRQHRERVCMQRPTPDSYLGRRAPLASVSTPQVRAAGIALPPCLPPGQDTQPCVLASYRGPEATDSGYLLIRRSSPCLPGLSLASGRTARRGTGGVSYLLFSPLTEAGGACLQVAGGGLAASFAHTPSLPPATRGEGRWGARRPRSPSRCSIRELLAPSWRQQKLQDSRAV